jgi:hypothetical protein
MVVSVITGGRSLIVRSLSHGCCRPERGEFAADPFHASMHPRSDCAERCHDHVSDLLLGQTTDISQLNHLPLLDWQSCERLGGHRSTDSRLARRGHAWFQV